MVLMTFRPWCQSQKEMDISRYICPKDKYQWTYLVREAFLKVEISLTRSTRRIQEIGPTRSIPRIGEEENFLCPFRCVWLPYQRADSCLIVERIQRWNREVKKANKSLFMLWYALKRRVSSLRWVVPMNFLASSYAGVEMKKWNIHGGIGGFWILFNDFHLSSNIPRRGRIFVLI